MIKDKRIIMFKQGIISVADDLLLLGLDSCETGSQLKAAYRSEISKWHPDHFINNPVLQLTATERSMCIIVAYEHLSELLKWGPLHRSPPRTRITPASKPEQAFRTQAPYVQKPGSKGFPDPDVVEVYVKSSHIVSTGYSRANGTLYIKFKGSVHAYLHVPESVFSEFIAAKSHGRFAYRYIYGQYDAVRYEPEVDPILWTKKRSE